VVQLILTRNVKLVHRRTASRARLSKDLIAAATRQAVDLFQGYRRGSKGEHSRGKLFAAIMNGGLYWQTFVHDMPIPYQHPRCPQRQYTYVPAHRYGNELLHVSCQGLVSPGACNHRQ
jgi:hypothetical protein